jgi:hypothetical protein
MANLDEGVLQSVINANFKNVGDLPALVAAQLAQNSASHQKAMDQVRELVLLEGLGQRAGHDIGEAAGVTGIQGLTNTLAAAIAQILTKQAQTTPPVTP